jgi:hypothetical protein
MKLLQKHNNIIKKDLIMDLNKLSFIELKTYKNNGLYLDDKHIIT